MTGYKDLAKPIFPTPKTARVLRLTYLCVNGHIFSPVGSPLSRHCCPVHGVTSGHLGGRGIAGYGSGLREPGAISIQQGGVGQAVHI